MKKSNVKKVSILFKRELQLNKKLFFFIFVPIIIILTIILNINFAEEYTKYLIIIIIFCSFLLSSAFVIPQASINLEKNNVYKSLKSFPISNTHVFLSKLFFFFFAFLFFYLVPMFLISIIGNVPKLLEPFLSANAYWIYMIGLFLIFFTIGIINLILAFINNKIVGYVFNIVLFLIIIANKIPGVDSIDKKIFRELFMVRGFLKLSILISIMIIPLIYLGIKVVNSKITYKLYNK